MSNNYSHNNRCIDCGKRISNKATRCQSCMGKNNSGENHCNYRGATICPQCGSKKSSVAEVCYKCRDRSEENSPNYRGGTIICPQCDGKKDRGAEVCWQCYVKNNVGENHPSWRGGINGRKSKDTRNISRFEYANWRLQVFERDNFICQHCQKRGGKLRAHHILNFSSHEELQLDVDNGITLCNKCHNLFHSLFGQRKNNLGQLEWFFKT